MNDKQMLAYPSTSWSKAGDFLGANDGMTLRDYFAAKAMQGILVNSGRNGFESDDYKKTVNFAYKMADAMMEARAL